MPSRILSSLKIVKGERRDKPKTKFSATGLAGPMPDHLKNVPLPLLYNIGKNGAALGLNALFP